MNVDTDTQYAFTRPIADHMFKNYDGVLKIDGEVGNKKAYDPRSYRKLAEAGMAARVVQACEDLRSAGTSSAEPRDCAKGHGWSTGTCWASRRADLPAPGPRGGRRARRGRGPGGVAARVPTSSAAWAALADRAFARATWSGVRVRPGRLPPRPGRAAPSRLAGARPDPVGARAQPGLPARAARAGRRPRRRSGRPTRRSAAALPARLRPDRRPALGPKNRDRVRKGAISGVLPHTVCERGGR